MNDKDARETAHWNCEHCGEKQTGEPYYKMKKQGYRETVSLWYCEDCIND